MSKKRPFTLTNKTEPPKLLKAIHKDSSGLWHMLFGHLGSTRLNLLSKANMVNVLSQTKHPNQLYEGCMNRKQHRRPFKWEVKKSHEVAKTLTHRRLTISSYIS